MATSRPRYNDSTLRIQKKKHREEKRKEWSFEEFKEWWSNPNTILLEKLYASGELTSKWNNSVSQVTVPIEGVSFTFAIKAIEKPYASRARFLNLDVLNRNLVVYQDVMPVARFKGEILCPVFHAIDDGTIFCLMGFWEDVPTYQLLLNAEDKEFTERIDLEDKRARENLSEEDFFANYLQHSEAQEKYHQLQINEKVHKLCKALLDLAQKCNEHNIAVVNFSLIHIGFQDDNTGNPLACLLKLEDLIFTENCFLKLPKTARNAVHLKTPRDVRFRFAELTNIVEYKFRSKRYKDSGALKPEVANQLKYFGYALFYISAVAVAQGINEGWDLNFNENDGDFFEFERYPREVLQHIHEMVDRRLISSSPVTEETESMLQEVYEKYYTPLFKSVKPTVDFLGWKSLLAQLK